MMYNIIPLMIILISLAVIIYIAARKFSILASLNLQEITQEKVNATKERIIQEKFDKNLASFKKILIKSFVPLLIRAKEFFAAAYHQVLEWEKKYQKKRLITATHVVKSRSKVRDLLDQAKLLANSFQFTKAENVYIEVIKLDHKNAEAYKGLGELYVKQGDLKQAKEAYEYLSQLVRNNLDILTNLAYLCQKTGDLSSAEKYYMQAIALDGVNVNLYLAIAEVYVQLPDYQMALHNLQQAERLEPNNSKILDKLVEISIIMKDLIDAKEYLEKIKKVNPDNQKILEWEEKIKQIA